MNPLSSPIAIEAVQPHRAIQKQPSALASSLVRKMARQGGGGWGQSACSSTQGVRHLAPDHGAGIE
jgi:hypothetical protein